MGSLSNYMENTLLNHVLGYAAYTPVDLYMGLSTADPTDDASGMAEHTIGADGYARVALTPATSYWAVAASRATTNSITIAFPQASGAGWGTITHWFICNHATNVTWGTNVQLIAHGALGTSKAIVSGNTPSIAASEADISISGSGSGGGMSTFLVNELFDHIFRKETYSAPSYYLGLVTTTPTDAATGTECTGNNYSRQQYTGGFNAASSGQSANTGIIGMPTPTGSWGPVTHSILMSAASSGSFLFWGDVTDQTPDNGDTVQYAAGAYVINLS